MKIHSRHLHAPLCGIFGPNSVNVARYASLIGTKSPTKWDAQLTESNFQTHPNMIINGKTGSSQLFLNDFRAWIGYHMGVSRIHTQIYEDYKYKLEGSEIYVCDV